MNKFLICDTSLEDPSYRSFRPLFVERWDSSVGRALQLDNLHACCSAWLRMPAFSICLILIVIRMTFKLVILIYPVYSYDFKLTVVTSTIMVFIVTIKAVNLLNEL